MATIIPRLLHFQKSSFFLLGPRGTGKSTWLRASIKKALWFNLLDDDLFQSLAARPERLAERIFAETSKRTIVIDEIQKLPELLGIVHRLMEDRKDLRFVLTGSSGRKLKRVGTDLLAGRALRKTMHPFLAHELGHLFNLEECLQTGMLPVIRFHREPALALRAYVSLYVKEEVQQERLTRNFGQFIRFLETASFSHASILNVSNISRECGVDRKVCEGYLGILEDLLLSFRIPVFTKRAARGLAAHEKFYFFDAGVFRALRPKGPLDKPAEIDGAGLEGLVAQHLVAWCDYREEGDQVFYWRSRGGVEVDFVVYGNTIFKAIEVKNTGKIGPGDLRSLKEFRKDYPESECILVYRGKDPILLDGILCLPATDFLRRIAPDKLL
jgi:predicted AAA+ superfamily ATPase